MLNISRTLNYLVFAGAAVLLVSCTSEKSSGYVGYVEAEYVYVAPPEAGWLMALHVREGDVVSLGAPLFELDKDRQKAAFAAADARAAEAGAMAANIETGARPEEIQRFKAQLAEAEAALRLARAERDRWLPLVAEGNASKARGDQVTADYQAAVARVEAAKDAIAVAELGGRDAERQAASAATLAAVAARAEAEWRLTERKVKAKASGSVEEIFHREGEFVNAGAPVLAILPDNGIKVRFFVPQAEVSNFRVGASVLITADSVGDPIEARVTYIATEAEFTPPVIYSANARDKLVFLIEAKPVDASNLRPGLPVDVAPL
ncbi:HlyD family efflux transporter periplasmic adaptor subunit [Hyphococcus flavus]|uniref:HlyD family efflux transporter periplasmic adaptor subunit n=1 Tax=Hyphococcus flavus TaxID=1866326 RepID=A0AAF0CIC9_9PROT|nr:HlyD family efflux transporter periplasmic adaptor subunit [Hyphococcus flavus]WDI32742.1 HlyD family efflux transporter periplasmic adaptor subunit [Hyphococcus flavus]